MHHTQNNDHHDVRQPTVMSVFGVDPVRIGGTEMFARELSLQLAEIGWNSVLCFLSEPAEHVRKFLDLPNVSLETLPNSTNGNWRACLNLMRLADRYQPQTL